MRNPFRNFRPLARLRRSSTRDQAGKQARHRQPDRTRPTGVGDAGSTRPVGVGGADLARPVGIGNAGRRTRPAGVGGAGRARPAGVGGAGRTSPVGAGNAGRHYRSAAYRPLCAGRIRQRQFTLVRRGLDPGEVTAFLHRVADDLAALHAELDRTRDENVHIKETLRQWQSRFAPRVHR